MADEPDNFALTLLRQMQTSIGDLRADAKETRASIESLREQMEIWQGTIASAAGFAVHANTRSGKIEKEVAALRERVEKLEKAR